MMSDIRKSCNEYAQQLGNYQDIDIDTLATKYCEFKDSGNGLVASEYLAALVLRFWFVIDKLYKQNAKLHFDHEEFYSWLVEAIELACQYRAWLKPEKKCNAQQAINQCINTVVLRHHYQYRLAKHKVNYNSISLQSPFDSTMPEITLEDTLVDMDNIDPSISTINNNGAYYFIQHYINKKKIVEAIILDTIAFNDTFKHTKKSVKVANSEGETYRYIERESEFWPFKLVQALSSLSEKDYMKYFTGKYSVKENEAEIALKTVTSANNQKLYKYLKNTLKSCRADAFAYLT